MISILFAITAACQAPIIELAATGGSSDRFAVMLTGDGGWRRIVVRVSRPNVSARTKQGYFAPTAH